ncbi:AEC family transporter [uncultured Massilia sp.]|uniref:AEC family transporter n=1 Tax=uncultured Massilia sp. TaxID=169973 RepID=UPI0025E13204|nr:AEC family transporter [uncultured Massilia sp.]
MSVLFSIVLPIFALIGAGWLARRAGWMGAAGAFEMNRFVVYLGIPALLFQVMAKASWRELDMPGFIAAFGLACAAIYALTVAVCRWRGSALPDASLDGLNAGYANVGFIGFPLCLAAFGPQSMTPVTITAIITVCILFGIAVTVVELGLNDGVAKDRILAKVGLSLLKNPMLLAPVLGACYADLGPPLPAGVDRFLSLLAAAASPCALVSLGLFIADARARPRLPALSVQVTLKLVGQPLLTWLLAHWVFHLPPTQTAIAVVLAALPTGTGPFMLANMYGRDAGNIAGSILASTVLSILTISVLITWFTQGGA